MTASQWVGWLLLTATVSGMVGWWLRGGWRRWELLEARVTSAYWQRQAEELRRRRDTPTTPPDVRIPGARGGMDS